MKKLKGSLLAKIAATVVLCLLALTFLGSAIGIGLLDDLGAYSGGYEHARQTMLENLCQERALEAAERVLSWQDAPEGVYAHENFRFVLYGPDEELIYSNWDGGETLAHVSLSYTVPTECVPRVTPTPTPDGQADVVFEAEPAADTYRVEGCIPAALTVEDEVTETLRLYELGYRLRYAAWAAAALSLLLGVLLFAFLCAAAGHRDESETITASWVDRLPFDLLTALVFCGMGIAFAILSDELAFHGIGLLLGVLLVLAAGLLLLLWCLSLAVRIKLGTLWRNTLCWRLLGFLSRGLRRLGRSAAVLLRTVPLVRRGCLVLAAVWAAEFFVMLLWRLDGEVFFLWFCEHLLLTALALYLLLMFQRLRIGARAIAAGNEHVEIDTRHMHLGLREHAEDLNHIRDGLSAAVAERMKSERLRTELITNVSHDIRTPLTSIVNYVDLLSREEPENEKVRAYLDVLQRQAAKLKKLIDDLIEASKAATGVLPVDKSRCELNVLLEQAAGEYAERLSEAGLELVTEMPERTVAVLADGRHLWRVFENLMQNILKYALPGTRVYLSLEEREGRAAVTFRNVSRERLHGSSDELLERFVRGDGARSSEGSGLGLSIAASLMQLQGGQLELTVDGDLFKVRLLMDTVE